MLKKTAQNVFILLIIFLLFGRLLLGFYGLTLTAIKLAGALVIILTALKMILQPPKRLSPETMRSSMEQDDISFSPMAMPLLVGPGSMALMLGYTEQFGYVWEGIEALRHYSLLLVAVLLVTLITYVVLRYSKYLFRLLGPGGLIGMGRIMAFMLLAIGAQHLINAVKEVVAELNR